MSLVAYNTLCELVLTPRTPRCLRVARLTPGHVCWAAALQAYHEVFMSFSLWKLGHGCHLRINRREKESRERRSRTFRSYSTGSPPVRCLLGHVTDLGLHMPHYPERCICRQNLRPRSGILMTPPPPPPPPVLFNSQKTHCGSTGAAVSLRVRKTPSKQRGVIMGWITWKLGRALCSCTLDFILR